MTKTFKRFFLCGVFALIFSAAATELPPELHLQAGKLELTLSRKRAYGVKTFIFDGQKLLIDRGANGNTLAEKKGVYWGGSEKSEKLLSLEIQLDGQSVSPEKADFSGNRILVQRITQIGNLRCTTRWLLTPQGLCWQNGFEALRDQVVHALYLCAWSFDPATESYFGVDGEGKEFEGTFANQGTWQVNRDLRSLTMCWPKQGHAATICFPQVITAKGRKCTVWDLKQYHKFYLELPQPALIAAGSKSPLYTLYLLPFAGKNTDEFRRQSLELQKSDFLRSAGISQ